MSYHGDGGNYQPSAGGFRPMAGGQQPPGQWAGQPQGYPPPRQPQRTRVLPTPQQDPYGPYDPAGQPPQRQQPPGGYPPARPRRRRRRWGIGRTLLVLLLLFLMFPVGAWLYLDFNIDRVDALADYDGRPAAGAGTNWLIVGSDSREGLDAEDQRRLRTGEAGGQRTDTIMLAHLPDNGDVQPTLVSFPRDFEVEIPGHGVNKINAAYAFGGAPLLVQTVEGVTDLRIDHYAEIGFGGFANVVDAIGGVEMDIETEMHDTKTGVTIPAGRQKLDGADALAFVRMRYSSATTRSDLDRVVNQRKFIGALAEQIATPGTLLNPMRLFPLLGAAPDALTIDAEDHLHHLFGLAWAMRGIADGGMVTTTIPVTSGSATHWDEAKAKAMFDALRNDQPVPEESLFT